MTLAANALQKAIYTRLSSQLGSTKVYDYIPDDAAFPYVVIGADTSIPWDTKTDDGQEYTLTLHIWDSDKAGRKSVKTLMETVYAALHEQQSSLVGCTVTLIRCEFVETFQETGFEGDSDNYYHGVMRFRALVET